MVDTIDSLYVKKVLMNLGWKDYQAAALCGQLMQRSDAVISRSMNENTVFGVGKWKDIYDHETKQFKPGRLTELAKFAKSQGKKIHDVDMQTNFIHHELTEGTMKDVGDKLKATSNIDDAVLVSFSYAETDSSNSELYDKVSKCAKILM